MSMSPN